MKTEEAAGIQIIRLAVFGSLLAGLTRTWADPDLWGHLRFGGDIISNGLPQTDSYSFTSDVRWINHEWLSEVAMHLAWSAAGAAGLIALKMALILATVVLVAVTIRHDRIAPVERDVLLFALIIGIWARVFVVRPQMFSMVLFAALLWILRTAERGRSRLVWLLPILFAVWVNAHGGWIVGLGTLALWTAGAISPFRAPGGDEGPLPIDASRGATAAAALLAIPATLVNPYGIGMWSFLRETVGLQRPNISDWRPLLESGVPVIVPWIISAALAIVALTRAWRRIPFAHIVIVVTLGITTIRVNRLDVFFMLSVVMLLGGQIGAARPPTLQTQLPLWTRRARIITGTAIAAGIALSWSFRAQLSCIRLDGPWMPERESGAFIAQNGLQGRLLVWFDWGQYAIWHFAPLLRVSLDGRRETVYSDRYVAEHLRLYFEPDTAIELLDRLAPDYAWLPRDLPLVSVLERRRWTPIFSGPVSVVLARDSSHPTHAATLGSRACFPGP